MYYILKYRIYLILQANELDHVITCSTKTWDVFDR